MSSAMCPVLIITPNVIFQDRFARHFPGFETKFFSKDDTRRTIRSSPSARGGGEIKILFDDDRFTFIIVT
jgi:hypothetical protein